MTDIADPVDAVADVFCRATLNFAARRPGLSGAEIEVDILEGRTADLPGWEECGFELVDHSSSVSSWDDAELKAVHHPEMEELAKHMTHCDVALVSSHIKRGPAQAQRHQDLAPISFVHSDFAAGYDHLVRGAYVQPDRDGVIRAMERNGVSSDDVQRSARLVILQFWRNLGPARMDFPLGFCDARTVTPAHCRPFPVSDYAGSGVDFNALAVFEPSETDRYRWYAFSEMRPDETVAFRTYDTDLVDRAETWFTPHSAFRDPDVEIGKPARSSIELRAICLFA